LINLEKELTTIIPGQEEFLRCQLRKDYSNTDPALDDETEVSAKK